MFQDTFLEGGGRYANIEPFMAKKAIENNLINGMLDVMRYDQLSCNSAQVRGCHAPSTSTSLLTGFQYIHSTTNYFRVLNISSTTNKLEVLPTGRGEGKNFRAKHS